MAKSDFFIEFGSNAEAFAADLRAQLSPVSALVSQLAADLNEVRDAASGAGRAAAAPPRQAPAQPPARPAAQGNQTVAAGPPHSAPPPTRPVPPSAGPGTRPPGGQPPRGGQPGGQVVQVINNIQLQGKNVKLDISGMQDAISKVRDAGSAIGAMHRELATYTDTLTQMVTRMDRITRIMEPVSEGIRMAQATSNRSESQKRVVKPRDERGVIVAGERTAKPTLDPTASTFAEAVARAADGLSAEAPSIASVPQATIDAAAFSRVVSAIEDGSRRVERAIEKAVNQVRRGVGGQGGQGGGKGGKKGRGPDARPDEDETLNEPITAAPKKRKGGKGGKGARGQGVDIAQLSDEAAAELAETQAELIELTNDLKDIRQGSKQIAEGLAKNTNLSAEQRAAAEAIAADNQAQIKALEERKKALQKRARSIEQAGSARRAAERASAELDQAEVVAETVNAAAVQAEATKAKAKKGGKKTSAASKTPPPSVTAPVQAADADNQAQVDAVQDERIQRVETLLGYDQKKPASLKDRTAARERGKEARKRSAERRQAAAAQRNDPRFMLSNQERAEELRRLELPGTTDFREKALRKGDDSYSAEELVESIRAYKRQVPGLDVKGNERTAKPKLVAELERAYAAFEESGRETTQDLSYNAERTQPDVISKKTARMLRQVTAALPKSDIEKEADEIILRDLKGGGQGNFTSKRDGRAVVTRGKQEIGAYEAGPEGNRTAPEDELRIAELVKKSKREERNAEILAATRKLATTDRTFDPYDPIHEQNIQGTGQKAKDAREALGRTRQAAVVIDDLGRKALETAKALESAEKELDGLKERAITLSNQGTLSGAQKGELEELTKPTGRIAAAQERVDTLNAKLDPDRDFLSENYRLGRERRRGVDGLRTLGIAEVYQPGGGTSIAVRTSPEGPGIAVERSRDEIAQGVAPRGSYGLFRERTQKAIDASREDYERQTAVKAALSDTLFGQRQMQAKSGDSVLASLLPGLQPASKGRIRVSGEGVSLANPRFVSEKTNAAGEKTGVRVFDPKKEEALNSAWASMAARINDFLQAQRAGAPKEEVEGLRERATGSINKFNRQYQSVFTMSPKEEAARRLAEEQAYERSLQTKPARAREVAQRKYLTEEAARRTGLRSPDRTAGESDEDFKARQEQFKARQRAAMEEVAAQDPQALQAVGDKAEAESRKRLKGERDRALARRGAIFRLDPRELVGALAAEVKEIADFKEAVARVAAEALASGEIEKIKKQNKESAKVRAATRDLQVTQGSDIDPATGAPRGQDASEFVASVLKGKKSGRTSEAEQAATEALDAPNVAAHKSEVGTVQVLNRILARVNDIHTVLRSGRGGLGGTALRGTERLAQMTTGFVGGQKAQAEMAQATAKIAELPDSIFRAIKSGAQKPEASPAYSESITQAETKAWNDLQTKLLRRGQEPSAATLPSGDAGMGFGSAAPFQRMGDFERLDDVGRREAQARNLAQTTKRDRDLLAQAPGSDARRAMTDAAGKLSEAAAAELLAAQAQERAAAEAQAAGVGQRVAAAIDMMRNFRAPSSVSDLDEEGRLQVVANRDRTAAEEADARQRQAQADLAAAQKRRNAATEATRAANATVKSTPADDAAATAAAARAATDARRESRAAGKAVRDAEARLARATEEQADAAHAAADTERALGSLRAQREIAAAAQAADDAPLALGRERARRAEQDSRRSRGLGNDPEGFLRRRLAQVEALEVPARPLAGSGDAAGYSRRALPVAQALGLDSVPVPRTNNGGLAQAAAQRELNAAREREIALLRDELAALERKRQAPAPPGTLAITAGPVTVPAARPGDLPFGASLTREQAELRLRARREAARPGLAALVSDAALRGDAGAKLPQARAGYTPVDPKTGTQQRALFGVSASGVVDSPAEAMAREESRLAAVMAQQTRDLEQNSAATAKNTARKTENTKAAASGGKARTVRNPDELVSYDTAQGRANTIASFKNEELRNQIGAIGELSSTEEQAAAALALVTRGAFAQGDALKFIAAQAGLANKDLATLKERFTQLLQAQRSAKSVKRANGNTAGQSSEAGQAVAGAANTAAERKKREMKEVRNPDQAVDFDSAEGRLRTIAALQNANLRAQLNALSTESSAEQRASAAVALVTQGHFREADAIRFVAAQTGLLNRDLRELGTTTRSMRQAQRSQASVERANNPGRGPAVDPEAVVSFGTAASRARTLAMQTEEVRQAFDDLSTTEKQAAAAALLFARAGFTQGDASKFVAAEAGVANKALLDLSRATMTAREALRGADRDARQPGLDERRQKLEARRQRQQRGLQDDAARASLVDARSTRVLAGSTISDETRREVVALRALSDAQANSVVITQQQIEVFRRLSAELSADGKKIGDIRQAFADVNAAATRRTGVGSLRTYDVNEIAKHVQATTPPPPTPPSSGGGGGNSGAGDRGRSSGEEFGIGFSGGAQSAIEQRLFGNNGFWSRILGSTGAFIVRNFTAGFVFGLTNALQDAVAQAIETEAIFVRVSHALEETGRAAGDLRGQLTQISTDYGVSLEQVYNTAAGLTGLFDDIDDVAAGTRVAAQLEMISNGALNATEAMGVLSSITSAYGIRGADDLEHIADVLTTIQNRVGVNIETTSEGIGRIAGLANQLGLSFEEAGVYVGEIAKKTNQGGAAAGEQFSRILSVIQTGRGQAVLNETLGEGSADNNKGITQALQRRSQLADPNAAESETNQSGYSQALQILLANYKNLTKAQQDNIAVTLGGQRQAAAVAALLSDGAEVLNTVRAAYEESGTAEERATRISQQLNNQIKILQSNFVNLITALIHSGLLDAFGAMLIIMNKVLGATNGLITAIGDFADQNAATKFLLNLAAGALGAAAAFLVLRKAVGGIRATIASVRGTQQDIRNVANPPAPGAPTPAPGPQRRAGGFREPLVTPATPSTPGREAKPRVSVDPAEQARRDLRAATLEREKAQRAAEGARSTSGGMRIRDTALEDRYRDAQNRESAAHGRYISKISDADLRPGGFEDRANRADAAIQAREDAEHRANRERTANPGGLSPQREAALQKEVDEARKRERLALRELSANPANAAGQRLRPPVPVVDPKSDVQKALANMERRQPSANLADSRQDALARRTPVDLTRPGLGDRLTSASRAVVQRPSTSLTPPPVSANVPTTPLGRLQEATVARPLQRVGDAAQSLSNRLRSYSESLRSLNQTLASRQSGLAGNAQASRDAIRADAMRATEGNVRRSLVQYGRAFGGFVPGVRGFTTLEGSANRAQFLGMTASGLGRATSFIGKELQDALRGQSTLGNRIADRVRGAGVAADLRAQNMQPGRRIDAAAQSVAARLDTGGRRIEAAAGRWAARVQAQADKAATSTRNLSNAQMQVARAQADLRRAQQFPADPQLGRMSGRVAPLAGMTVAETIARNQRIANAQGILNVANTNLAAAQGQMGPVAPTRLQQALANTQQRIGGFLGNATANAATRLAGAGSGLQAGVYATQMRAMSALAATSSAVATGINGVTGAFNKLNASGLLTQGIMAASSIILLAVVQELGRAAAFSKDLSKAYENQTKSGSTDSQEAEEYKNPYDQLVEQNSDANKSINGYMRSLSDVYTNGARNLGKLFTFQWGDIRTPDDVASRQAGLTTEEQDKLIGDTDSQVFGAQGKLGKRVRDMANATGNMVGALAVTPAEITKANEEANKKIDDAEAKIMADESTSDAQKASAMQSLEKTRHAINTTTSNLLLKAQGISASDSYTQDSINRIMSVVQTFSNASLPDMKFAKGGIQALLKDTGLADDSTAKGLLDSIVDPAKTVGERTQAQVSLYENVLTSIQAQLDTPGLDADVREQWEQLYNQVFQAMGQARAAAMQQPLDEANALAAAARRGGNYAEAKRQGEAGITALQKQIDALPKGSVERLQKQAQQDDLRYAATQDEITGVVNPLNLAGAKSANSLTRAQNAQKAAAETLKRLKQTGSGASADQVQQAEIAKAQADQTLAQEQSSLRQAKRQATLAGITNEAARRAQQARDASAAVDEAAKTYGRESVQYQQALATQSDTLRSNAEADRQLANQLAEARAALADAEIVNPDAQRNRALQRAKEAQERARQDAIARGVKPEEDPNYIQAQTAVAQARVSDRYGDLDEANALAAAKDQRRIIMADTDEQRYAAQVAAAENNLTRVRADARSTAADVANAENEVERARRESTEATKQNAKALRDARNELAVEQMGPGDAVGRARQNLANAEADVNFYANDPKYGVNSVAYVQAMTARIRAQRELDDALRDIDAANRDLAIAYANARDDDLKSADLAVEAARAQLAAAQAHANGVETAEVIRARAAVVDAEAAARRARLTDQYDSIDFQLQMEQITAAQAIKMLQNILNTQDLTEKERRELMLKIKGLQDDINGALGDSPFNIGDIRLPSQYEIKQALGLDQVGSIWKANYAQLTASQAAAFTGWGMNGTSTSATGMGGAASVWNDNSSRVININGADINEVMAAIATYFGPSVAVGKSITRSSAAQSGPVRTTAARQY